MRDYSRNNSTLYLDHTKLGFDNNSLMLVYSFQPNIIYESCIHYLTYYTGNLKTVYQSLKII